MPGLFFLECFDCIILGDGDLPFDGESVLCSLDVLDGTFRNCFGGGSFSEVTATLDDLSRNAWREL
jgi:hypothetical protein